MRYIVYAWDDDAIYHYEEACDEDSFDEDFYDGTAYEIRELGIESLYTDDLAEAQEAVAALEKNPRLFGGRVAIWDTEDYDWVE